MSSSRWNRIKQHKFFYVRVYRKLLVIIIVSQAINVLLFLGIIYNYLNIPERGFYATSGITLPIMLTPMDRPNNTSEALLPPDPSVIETKKATL